MDKLRQNQKKTPYATAALLVPRAGRPYKDATRANNLSPRVSRLCQLTNRDDEISSARILHARRTVGLFVVPVTLGTTGQIGTLRALLDSMTSRAY